MTSDHEILYFFKGWSVLVRLGLWIHADCGAIGNLTLPMSKNIWNLRVAFIEKLAKMAVSGNELQK